MVGRPNKQTLTEVARELGFRRIESVQIVTGRYGATAEATGVLHRYQRTVPISLATAYRLVSAGAPCRIDRRSGRANAGRGAKAS